MSALLFFAAANFLLAWLTFRHWRRCGPVWAREAAFLTGAMAIILLAVAYAEVGK